MVHDQNFEHITYKFRLFFRFFRTGGLSLSLSLCVCVLSSLRQRDFTDGGSKASEAEAGS